MYSHTGRMIGKLSHEDPSWRVKLDAWSSQFGDGKFVVVHQALKNKKKRRASASSEELVDSVVVYDIKELQHKQLQSKMKDEQTAQPYGFRFWDSIAEVPE